MAAEATMFRTRSFSKNVTNGSKVVIGELPVPSASRILLLGCANYANNQVIWGPGIWRIRRNQVPVEPYDEIRDPVGAGTLAAPAEGIEFKGGDLLDILCENTSGVAVEMGMRIDFDQG
jgi:hypothetical protein